MFVCADPEYQKALGLLNTAHPITIPKTTYHWSTSASISPVRKTFIRSFKFNKMDLFEFYLSMSFQLGKLIDFIIIVLFYYFFCEWVSHLRVPMRLCGAPKECLTIHHSPESALHGTIFRYYIVYGWGTCKLLAVFSRNALVDITLQTNDTAILQWASAVGHPVHYILRGEYPKYPA